MSITNWPFFVNFAIFAVFLTLFFTELMAGIILLLFYDAAKKKVLPYIVPIWEVTGTFAAFWVVTADMAYPPLLIYVAALFAAPIVIFLILVVARNASISFAEYIMKRGWLDEKKLYQAYGLATVLIGLVVLMILSTIVSGSGINLATKSFSFGTWISAAGTIPYLLGVVVIAIGLAPVFYDLERFRRLSLPLTAAGVLLEVAALWLYSTTFLSLWLALPCLLTLAAPVLYQFRATAMVVTTKPVLAVLGTIIIFSLNFLVYPKAFLHATGGPLPVDAVTTSGPMVTAFDTLTVIGAVIVGLLMIFYLVSAYRADKPAVPLATVTATVTPKSP